MRGQWGSFKRAALLGAAICAVLSASAAGTSVPSTTRLGADVLPGLAKAQRLGSIDPAKTLVVAVTVKHDLAAIDRAEAALYDPSSPSYHQFLTPSEWRARFDASPARLAAIRRFVTAHGLTLVNPDLLGDYVMAAGTAAQVERTFSVRLVRFRDAAHGSFFANTNAPTVPANLGIDAVLGLESRDAYHLAGLTAARAKAPSGTQPQCVPDPAGGQACTGIMQPRDLWSAYDQPANNLGQGQTIGIIGEGQSADVIRALREFERTRGLPFVPVEVYHTDPADKNVPEAKRDDSGRIEWELDTQSSTGMAPDVSEVRLYFGTSLQLTELTGALGTWVNDPRGPLQASASLGACEDNPALDVLLGAAQRADMALLAQAAMEGRTLFASTGDTGAGCSEVVSENGIQYGPIPTDEYPSVDPNAVGVGGTILYTDGKGHRVLERAWDHTGGGPSHFVAQPAYQRGASPLLSANACVTSGDGTPYPPGQLCRGVADVSALSGDITISVDHHLRDPGLPSPISANGYDMVDYCPPNEPTSTTDPVSPGCAYNSRPGTMTDHFSEGGTSLSSPLWLGMWARVQAHHDAVNPKTLAPNLRKSLGFANYVIYKLARGAKTAHDFNDVTIGANPLPAGPGWDFPTGWGTPNVTLLTEDASRNHGTAPVSRALPGKTNPAPIYATVPNPPKCSYLFYDPSSDAPDGFTGQQDDQLDIVEGNFGLTPDGTKLRVVLSLKSLSKKIPTGSNYLDYETYWDYTPPGATSPTVYAVDAQVNSSGQVTYTDGTMSVSTAGGTTNYQFVPNTSSTATGSFGSGPGGRVEVDAPLSQVGSPKVGSVLSSPGAFTADGINAVATGAGFIADQDGPGKSYTLGQATCLG